MQFQKIKVNLGADGVDGDTWAGKVAVTAGTAIVTAGTINEVADCTVTSGSIIVTAGTIMSSGTVTGVGTVTDIAQVHNAGTVAELPDLPGGTIDKVTDCTITGGSIVMTAGTVTTQIDDLDGGTLDLLTAGTITRLEQGSVTVTSGTIAAGSIIITAGTMADVTVTSLSDLPGGTVDELTNITTVGTVADIGVIHNAGTVAGLPDLPGGTVDSITNVAGGTVQVHQKAPNPILFVTQTGTEAIGTLIAAPGADTAIYLNELSISAHEDDIDIQIAYGTAETGDGVVTRVFTKAGGGIQKSFPIASSGGKTNTALTYTIINGSGTKSINCSYWTE